ncbi:MAG: RNA pseudouridine synthase [Alphaproteobacteria bacterium CG_4_9_14_3_um_filter_47_13]|nr:MAG: RNA pseudouridine synthase [Alphaproteobacteria bacterium CG_4_9_14_3_um_filter_47_13]
MSQNPDDFTDDEDILTCIVQEEDHDARLDKMLAQRFPDFSRSRLKALILEGAVSLDGVRCTDPSCKVKKEMVLAVTVPPPVDGIPEAENIPLEILYEDDALLVVNKQVGLVVHPGAGHYTGTLVNALLYHCGDSLSGIGGVRRPGIVHRLDKDTSGLMVVAKSDQAHQALSAQLADRTLGRHYKAVVWGVPLRKGFIDQPIGRHAGNRLKMSVNHKNGREAGTHYQLGQSYHGTVSLVDCWLESGRTHQVRVHMAFIKHPLLGDTLYGQQRNSGESALKKAGYEPDVIAEILAFPRQALHAWRMGFIHPLSGEEMFFEAPLPEDLTRLLSLL